MNDKLIPDSSKKILQILAQNAISAIYENKLLEQRKEYYTKQIQLIKNILTQYSKKSSLKTEDINNSKIYFEIINTIQNSLKSNNDQLITDKKKLEKKYQTSLEEIFNEESSLKQSSSTNFIDNFILINQILEKDNEIKSLNSFLNSLRSLGIFRENSKEISVNKKVGYYHMNNILNDLAQRLMTESTEFNAEKNKCLKKEKKKNILINQSLCLKEAINFFNNILNENNKNKNKKNEDNSDESNESDKNKKNQQKMLMNSHIIHNDNKLSLFNYNEETNNAINEMSDNEENNPNDEKEKNESINNQYTSFAINNKTINKTLFPKTTRNNNKEKKNKINLLTVDELFDINNEEGEQEAIIDEELHSDDETVFEIKVKMFKKITVQYLPKIRKQVPRINLSQIEFNKQKIMNEADLYSDQRRKFNMQNIDENIKAMKKKINKIKKKCKLNKKKCIAIENFSKTAENTYKTLRAIKTKSSVNNRDINFMRDIFYGRNNKNQNIKDEDLDDIVIDSDDNEAKYDMIDEDDKNDYGMDSDDGKKDINGRNLKVKNFKKDNKENVKTILTYHKGDKNNSEKNARAKSK